MKALFFRSLLIGLASWVAVGFRTTGSLPAAYAQSDRTDVSFSYPVDGSTISGTIQISGTVIDPAFQYYELAYATSSQANSAWTSLQPPVAQQVQGGILGLWDTTQVADGAYSLRLRLIRQDGSNLDAVIGIQITNASPTPLPTIVPVLTPTAFIILPTAGPSPTPLIIQPPTRTPLPTVTPGGPTPTPAALFEPGTPFDTGMLTLAACYGSLAAIAVFIALALYQVWRASRRGRLDSIIAEIRRDIVNPVLGLFQRRRK
jgi:hypothetical protein